jgi:hypothetical protein
VPEQQRSKFAGSINSQAAPYPDELADLVEKCTYRPEWQVYLASNYDRGQGSAGLTLIVLVHDHNSYPPHDPISVQHLFPVPPAAYNRASWQHWLFDQLVLVEQHEAMEWFEIDGVKPYAPNHGPGEDPYIVHDPTSDVARRTSFRGEVQPEIAHYRDTHDGLGRLRS